MEVEGFKMIYLMDFIDKSTDQSLYSNKEIKEEINSYNIRIFGSDFVKKNENKVKLAINNKKRKIKEKIGRKEFTGDNIKIKIIFDKTKLNYSYMFENSVKLKEISKIIKIKNLRIIMMMILNIIKIIIMIIMMMMTIILSVPSRIP